MKSNIIIKIALLLLVSNIAKAQDLLDQLYFEEEKKTLLTEATFKMLRIGFGHSVETRKKGILELSAYTRYWNIPEGEGIPRETTNFGADRMTARFGADYAITNRTSIGFGGSNEGVFDGYLKYRLIRQKTGEKKTPFSLTLLGSMSYRSKNIENVVWADGTVSNLYNANYSAGNLRRGSINKNDSFSDKTNIIGQFLLARKIDRNLSLQLSPTIIVRGSNTFDQDPSLQLALGFGGRYKIGKHVSIASEYFYVPQQYKLESIETFGPFSLGINWEVSKVQIQMFLTHTGNFSEDLVITETPVNFNTKDGNLFFGWNFSYVFHLKHKK